MAGWDAGRAGPGVGWALLIALAFVLHTEEADGQSPPRRADPATLGLDTFGLADGLPGLSITDLTVSQDGRLWLIASGRLASFDGATFEEHTLDRSGLPTGQELIGIQAGTGDTIWAGLGRNVVSYVHGRVAVHVSHDQTVRDVWQDAEGGLWAWDDRGVLRARSGTLVRTLETPFEATPRSLPRGAGQATVHLKTLGGARNRRYRARGPGDLVASRWPVPGVVEASVVRREGTDGRVEFSRLDGSDSERLPETAGTPLHWSADGLLWTRTPRGIGGWADGTLVREFELPPDAQITPALEDPEGNLWLGTVTGGLLRVGERAVRVIGAAQGLTDGQVLRVGAAGADGVLAVEESGRLMRYSDSSVDTLFTPASPSVVALGATTARDGTVWTVVKTDLVATLVGRSPEGGERRIELGGFRPQNLQEDPDVDGLLWLLGGRVRKVDTRAPDPSPGRNLLEGGFRARHVRLEGGGSALAVGETGLGRITPTGFEVLSDSAVGWNRNARAVHRSEDGTVWIGRYDAGLLVLRDGRFHEVRMSDGLWDDGVSSILEDDRGTLWMSSNRGVHRVAKEEVYELIEGRRRAVRGRGYGLEAGFLNPETSGWPGLRTPDGRLWFPTFGGLAVVDPEAVRAREARPPNIRILRALAGDSLLPRDGVARLPAGVRRLDVAYGAILLGGQDAVRYSVRLDGVDDEWVDVGTQRQVSYGALPPGELTFRVRASNGTGPAAYREAALPLVVPQRFTETGAFTALMGLVTLGALAGLYRLRVGRIRRRELELEGLVHERTRELGQALATVEGQANQLRSLDQAKSRFFANVSHELRTPLTLVQGPLQDVLDGRLGPVPDPVRQQVETVLASGRRLGELVGQLLDVARIEAGSFTLNRREQDIGPLLRRLDLGFHALARARGILWTAELPDAEVPAYIDADRFEKVATNLLSNALKFTPEGGEVSFTVRLEEVDGQEAQLVCAVEDTGPGIPEAQRARIFERFHQVDDSPSRRHEGAGLGLALARDIVELHGGTLSVESKIGLGSTFTARLPIAAPGDEVGGAILDREDGRSGEPSTPPTPTEAAIDGEPDVSEPTGPASAPPDDRGVDAPPPTDPDDHSRPTILVVEDHADLRAYLRRHLSDDYRIVEARNGVEGLERARAEPPDLILCDLMMPEMDGEALCREVRLDPELAFLPIVVVTARASRPSRLAALEEGADDYLVKPFDPEELRLRIRNLFAARRRLEARLADRGEELPFVGLTHGRSDEHADLTDRLDTVLRERIGDEDFGVDDLASALFMSRSALYRAIQEALGSTPMEVVWRYRLDQAAHWLRHTDATVSEVAYACGFKTVPHFTRRFKSHHGRTPAAYRLAAQG